MSLQANLDATVSKISPQDLPVPKANVTILLGLMLLPFWTDSIAMLIYLCTGSAFFYSLSTQLIDFIALIGLSFGIRQGLSLLLKTYGWLVAAPGILYGIALFTSIIYESGNQEFMLAALRYLLYVSFISTILLHTKSYTSQANIDSDEVDLLTSALGRLALILAILSIFQLAFSDPLSSTLQSIHEGFTPPEKTNAVLTSLSLEKSFASLSLRNPIELSYIGLMILCFALARRTHFYMVAAALAIIICGRSNTTILAALAVMLVHSFKGSSWIRNFRFLIAFLVIITGGLFIWYLPEIYLGSGSNWEDFIVVLTYQRLGMLLALPEMLATGGFGLLISGMPTPLNDLVDSLYSIGLLPELFADGGAIAVFDIMWFGFMMVGGLPFVLGGLALIGLGLKFRKSPEIEASSLHLYSVGIIIISFSSQILLSRYGLYFFCFLLASLATNINRPQINS